MPYKVQLPNNTIVEIDDNVPPEQARLMIAREFPELFKRKQGFMPAAKAGYESGIGAMQSFGADVAEKAGFDTVSKGLRKYAEANKEEARRHLDPTTQEDIDAAWKHGITSGIGALKQKYITEPAGGMAGSLVPSAIGAAAGAVSPVPGGAALGFSIPFFAQSAGENQERQRQVNPAQDPNLLRSTTYALAQTALNFVGLGAVVGRGGMGLARGLAIKEAEALAPLVVSGKMTQEAATKALGGRLRQAGIGTAEAVGVGAATNVADEALRRHQAGQELGSPEAKAAYRDQAIAAAVLGGPLGAAHGIGGRGVGQQIVTDATVKRQDIEARRQQEEAAVVEAARLAEQQRIEAETPPPVVVDPKVQKQRLKESIGDQARRAVEARDNAGVLQVSKVGEKYVPEMIPGDPTVRPDAQAAFSDAQMKQDMFGSFPAPPDPAGPVMTPGRRISDGDLRAPVTPMLEQPGQAVLPLTNEYPVAQPLELTPPPAELPQPDQQRRIADAIPEPKLSSREQFKGLVYEGSPTWKNGKLDGHDLETPQGISELQKTLKSYAKNLEDNERNAPRRSGLDEAVYQLGILKEQLKPQPELVFKGGKDVSAIPDAPMRSADDVQAVQQREVPDEIQQPSQAPVTGSGVPDLEVSDGTDAVPARLPDFDGAGDGVSDRVAGAGVQSEVAVDAALTPIQERARFGRVTGATVDGGGHALKSRQQVELGRAVADGDFPAVTSALANSKNVMIKHLGEQASKLEGVQVQPGKESQYDPAKTAVSVEGKKVNDEHTVGHEVAHALTQYAIDKPTKEQKPIVAKLKVLFEHVKNATTDKEYGLKDVHEFVAEAYTNPSFQQKLTTIKYQNTSAWGKFTHYVAQLIGLKPDNAFTEFMSLAEALEGTGLKAKANKAKVKYLGSYVDSSTPRMDRSAAGSAIDAARGIRAAGGKATLRSWWDKIQMSTFDNQYGVTRFLEHAWTRATPTGKKATARALLQMSTYNDQMARESLAVGTVGKNSEDSWEVIRTPDTFKTYLDAVQAMPTTEDKLRVSNGMLTNLSYAEREALLANKKSIANQMLAQGRVDMKAAKQLKGVQAARAVKAARAKIDAAKAVLDTDYKRPKDVTDANIIQAKLDAQTPEGKRLVEAARAINMQHIETALQGGLITADAANLWRQNQHYIPLQRLMEDVDYDMPMRRGGASTRDFKGFDSSSRDVNDVTENLIRQRLFIVDAAVRNSANLKAMQELEATPGNPAGVTRFDSHPGGRDVITLKEAGEKVYFRVDDPMAFKTFRGLVENAPGWVNALEDVTRFFRESIMLSPPAIWRNLVRDTQEVWVYDATTKSLAGVTKDVAGQFAKSLPGIMREGFSDRVHQPHYDVQAFGITGAKEFTSLNAERRAILREQLKRTGSKDWADSADRALDVVSRIFKPLQNLATEGELAPRNQVFKNKLAATGSRTEAAMTAINTLDFRRRGASDTITFAKKLIPFFNSSLQGFYKMIKTLEGDNLSSNKDKVMAAFMFKGLKMAAAATAYQVVMSDDEEYMQVPKSIRDQNILVPIPDSDGLFFKMSLPFEFGSIFWTLPANILDYMNGHQNGEDFRGAMKAALMHMLPGYVPQAIKPVLENKVNYSFFTGKPIESESQRRLAPEERAYSTTSSTAKEIGNATGMSPIQIDNILKGYFGSLGKFFTDVVDMALSDGTEPETAGNRLPIIKDVVTDPLQSAHRDRFYKLKETVDMVHTTASTLAKNGKVEEANAYLNKETNGVSNRKWYEMHRGVNALSRELMEAMQMEKKVRESSTSPSMKRAQLEQIKRAINHKIAQRLPALRQYSEQEEPEEEEETEDES